MTILTVFSTSAPYDQRFRSHDPLEIARQIRALGANYERWPARKSLDVGADQASVLAAFQPEIERLKTERGYTTADVVRLYPDHPDRLALRKKFIEEHTHPDDEVRFFVEGGGAFYIHVGDAVFQMICEAGDLLSVPAGVKHWFDTGPLPRFTAIRLFVSPEGWVATFTGDRLSESIPRFDRPVLANAGEVNQSGREQVDG
jgi:1,2-dihydroxy-3-keto-5-methylthiopentene dioxygenase